MTTIMTPEHVDLAATVRAFLAKASDEAAVRAQMVTERGWDRVVWAQLAGQLGLAGLLVPEELGGSGASHVEVGIVMEEMGRVLLCAPYLGTSVLAADTLITCADAATQADLLPGVAAGELVVTVALAEPRASWDPASGVSMRATSPAPGRWRLDGTKSMVLDGHMADVALVVAHAPEGVALFRVDPRGPGVRAEPLPTLDLTRKLATLSFDGADARKVSDGDILSRLRAVLARTVSVLAAEQVGAAHAALDMAIAHATTRIQFGRPIGSFQAVKHLCADMLVATELARSTAVQACADAAQDAPTLLEAAALAKAACSVALSKVAGDALQVHGGTGFTWEHPVHLYLKRGKSSELLFGSPAHHRRQLARMMGL